MVGGMEEESNRARAFLRNGLVDREVDSFFHGSEAMIWGFFLYKKIFFLGICSLFFKKSPFFCF